MADEKPSLHIDTDWKKQAQEEKRKLAEEEQKKRAAEPAAKPAGAMPGAPSSAASAGRPSASGRAAGPAGAASREMPPPSFATLVQSILTQVLYYLGDLTPRGAEPNVNLDMAKHHVDTLNVLEEKTRNNLTDDEKRMLDAALYESRMRYVSVATQYIS